MSQLFADRRTRIGLNKPRDTKFWSCKSVNSERIEMISIPAHNYFFAEMSESKRPELPWEKVFAIEKNATAIDHAFSSNHALSISNKRRVESVFAAVFLNGTKAGFEKACTEFVSGLSNLPEGDFFFVDLLRKGRL